MSLMSLGVNGLWAALCLPEAWQFHRATRHVEAEQRRSLSRLLRANRGTGFGRKHGFEKIRSVEEYQATVPFSDYESFRPAIDAIMKGEDGLLTAGRPVRLVPTGGSSGGRKLIPYTPALRREFQAGIAPWIAGQFLRYPVLLAGTAYWSISPAGPPVQTESAVPVGFDDDTDYLNPVVSRLLGRCMAVPSLVSGIGDMDTFRYVTLLFLLKARDLSFISIWNPTFLSLLLNPLDSWGERLCRDLQSGRLAEEAVLSSALRARIEASLGCHPKRAAEIRDILFNGASDRPERFAPLWPRLKVISCWAEAAAEGPAHDLQRSFPDAVIAPKGLLATEGLVSVPLGQAEGSALAVRSHFFEFLEDNDPGRVRTAWQLEAGRSYAVVLSTGGGLYRYRLGDLVRVTGFLGQCPLLRFVGRCDRVSDLYGEKLNESHVAGVVSDLLARHHVRASFRMLAPDGEPRPDRYVLLLAEAPGVVPFDIAPLEAEWDAALRSNFHYDYCRQLGQLKQAQLRWLDCGAGEAGRRYLLACMAAGQKAGDIKAARLDSRPGWAKALDFPPRERNGD